MLARVPSLDLGAGTATLCDTAPVAPSLIWPDITPRTRSMPPRWPATWKPWWGWAAMNWSAGC